MLSTMWSACSCEDAAAHRCGQPANPPQPPAPGGWPPPTAAARTCTRRAPRSCPCSAACCLCMPSTCPLAGSRRRPTHCLFGAWLARRPARHHNPRWAVPTTRRCFLPLRSCLCAPPPSSCFSSPLPQASLLQPSRNHPRSICQPLQGAFTASFASAACAALLRWRPSTEGRLLYPLLYQHGQSICCPRVMLLSQRRPSGWAHSGSCRQRCGRPGRACGEGAGARGPASQRARLSWGPPAAPSHSRCITEATPRPASTEVRLARRSFLSLCRALQRLTPRPCRLAWIPHCAPVSPDQSVPAGLTRLAQLTTVTRQAAPASLRTLF